MRHPFQPWTRAQASRIHSIISRERTSESFYDKDADLSLIKGQDGHHHRLRLAGHAHAQNLNDSGVKVTVGLRKDGASWAGEKAGLKVEVAPRPSRPPTS